MSDLFPGFATHDLEAPGARVHARTGGSGDPVLLLHGYPQTHAMWHRVAPRLTGAFSVVAADLRGYGDSGKPASTPDHSPYSKREMARDLVHAMDLLGFRSFHLVGHDRGGRVAHRLALDHPDRVRTLTVLDIAPTRHMYARTDFAFARAYYHWFFLIQPEPLPERLIGADPDFFLRTKLGSGSAGLEPFHPGAMAEYLRCFRDPATIRASCEDYRASASIDLAHDDADLSRTLTLPVLALWGARGVVHRCFDVLAAWRERAPRAAGGPLDCGHYIAEEAPSALLSALLPHLQRGAS